MIKQMVIISGIFHVTFLAGLIIASENRSEPVYFSNERIYDVALVSLPAKAIQPKRARVQTDKPYRVVPKKDAAVPDQDAALALKRTPKLLEEEPDAGPESPRSFETGTKGVRLDIDSFEFPYYLAAIQRKIQQNLHAPRLPGVKNLKTVIFFRVGRNGLITRMERENPSGNPVFDLAARRALERSDPLPPLPDGFGQEYLGVHFEFNYEP